VKAVRGKGQAIATAAFVTTLAAVTIMIAVPLLQFGLAEAAPSEKQWRALLEPLTESRLVGALARRNLLLTPSILTRLDVSERVTGFEALLGETPLDSAAWLQLAMARRDAGAPPERVASALALSRSTGRLEGELLISRVRFALPMWADLSPQSRQQTVADLLSGGWGLMSQDEQSEMRDVIAEASDEVRADLRTRLTRSGTAGRNIIQRVGLKAPPTPNGSSR
jgi:hypothetical protein